MGKRLGRNGVGLKGNDRPIQGDTILSGRILQGPFSPLFESPATMPDKPTPEPWPQRTHKHPGVRFRRHGESTCPIRGTQTQAWRGDCYLPPTTPIQAREHAGRSVFSLIVQMSSSRLFLDRVARQQSPSLLHRLTAIVLEKGLEVITIPANGNCVFSAVSHWRGSPDHLCSSV